MIIECPSCRTRFRLDEAKIKGRGARVRCRRCGDTIVVLKPEEPPQAPPRGSGAGLLDLRTIVQESLGDASAAASKREYEAPAPPSSSAERSFEEERSGETAGLEPGIDRFPAPEEKETAREIAGTGSPPLADLSVDFPPEEKIVLDLPPEPPKAEAPPDFLIGGKETLDFLKEEYKVRPEAPESTFSPGVSAPTPPFAPEPPLEERIFAPPPEFQIPPPEEAAPAPPEPRDISEAFRRMPSAARKGSTSRVRSPLVALVLLFVALAAGGAYLGFTKGGQDLLRGLVPGMESLWLRSSGKPGPQFDVRNLIGYYEPTTSAGNLFVIKGQVANMGRTRKSGIRVHATLLDGKDQTMAENTIYAGNVVPGETLRTASRAKIEEALSNRFGDKLVNMDVAPGKSVPFMVVFFNAPEGISAYRLEAKDGD